MGVSPFAVVAPRLIERGYSCVPIAPGTKAPGHFRNEKWSPMPDWRRFAHRLPTRIELQFWSTWPDAGVGIVADEAGWRIVAVDVDTDDAKIAAAIIGAIPRTTIIKKGSKGSTRFYRGPTVARSKSWRVSDGVQVADLIGPGRQSVLPPSLHPTTGKPYVWIAGDALEDVSPADLPELTAAHVVAIDEALRPFGYAEPQPLPERPALFECNDARGREYALGVLRGCEGDLARAQKGDRNGLMYFVVLRMARCVARGWLSEAETWAATWNACIANGVLADDGEHQFRATFASGLKRGLADPMPDPRNCTTDPAFAERIANLNRSKI